MLVFWRDWRSSLDDPGFLWNTLHCFSTVYEIAEDGSAMPACTKCKKCLTWLSRTLVTLILQDSDALHALHDLIDDAGTDQLIPASPELRNAGPRNAATFR